MMVKAFLEKAKIKTDYFFFVYTYGMGYAEAFTHVEMAARSAGLEFGYIDAIQMVDNITVDDDGVAFSDQCEVCYACLHNCPQNAIHMPVEASTARFRNEHVTLSDIIAANE